MTYRIHCALLFCILAEIYFGLLKWVNSLLKVPLLYNLGLPRLDSRERCDNIEIMNIQLKQIINGIENCTWSDNSNLAYRGKAKSDCFVAKDGVHLTKKSC